MMHFHMKSLLLWIFDKFLRYRPLGQFVYKIMVKSHEAVIGRDFLKKNILGPLLSINHFE